MKQKFLGLADFMARKHKTQTDIAKMLDCSNAMVSHYLSGISGISLERLAILLEHGMTPEEAFGNRVGGIIRESIIKHHIRSERHSNTNAMQIVVEGLAEILKKIQL